MEEAEVEAEEMETKEVKGAKEEEDGDGMIENKVEILTNGTTRMKIVARMRRIRHRNSSKLQTSID